MNFPLQGYPWHSQRTFSSDVSLYVGRVALGSGKQFDAIIQRGKRLHTSGKINALAEDEVS